MNRPGQPELTASGADLTRKYFSRCVHPHPRFAALPQTKTDSGSSDDSTFASPPWPHQTIYDLLGVAAAYQKCIG